MNDMNQVLEENFNEHYLDFRSYLMENGLTDAGIEATEQDQADLSNRYIPSSLYSGIWSMAMNSLMNC